MFFTSAQTATGYDDFYIGGDGEFYAGGDGELGGIGSFFKKLGKVVLPIAAIGVNAIPGIGQLASAGISMGIAAGQGALEKSGSGGGVAKGLNGITAYGNQLIAQLDAVLQSGNFDESVLQEAETLAGSLSDSTKVYQPKKGKDAAALASFKQQAAQKIGEIRSRAAARPARQSQQTGGGQIVTLPNGQQAQQVVTASGQIVYQPVSDDGFDMTKILLVGGLGLGAILLIKR